MTRNAALLTGIVVSLGASHALASPSITVDETVPLAASDIAKAIEIRVASPDVKVRVTRHADRLVITVGDRTQAIDDAADSRELLRVVALVIIGLSEQPPITSAPAPSSDREQPITLGIGAALGVPTTSRFGLRLAVGHQRTDGGIHTTPLLASLVTAIGPLARLVVSLGTDEHGTHLATSRSVLGRLGVEGRFGALGVEIGMAGFAWSNCHAETSTGAGPYGTARVYLPLFDSSGKLLVEVGGYYARTEHVACGTDVMESALDSSLEFDERHPTDEYAGHVGIGVEWPL